MAAATKTAEAMKAMNPLKTIKTTKTMSTMSATKTSKREPEPPALAFEEAATLLKALAHPLRLRMVCGLLREPRNLTRIVAALETPLSTAALHLGVLRRAGILGEERRGAEVVFRVADPRVEAILEVFCGERRDAPESWDWENLARALRPSGRARARRGT